MLERCGREILPLHPVCAGVAGGGHAACCASLRAAPQVGWGTPSSPRRGAAPPAPPLLDACRSTTLLSVGDQPRRGPRCGALRPLHPRFWTLVGRRCFCRLVISRAE